MKHLYTPEQASLVLQEKINNIDLSGKDDKQAVFIFDKLDKLLNPLNLSEWFTFIYKYNKMLPKRYKISIKGEGIFFEDPCITKLNTLKISSKRYSSYLCLLSDYLVPSKKKQELIRMLHNIDLKAEYVVLD